MIKKTFPIFVLILVLTLASDGLAQIEYDRGVGTSYSVMNLGKTPTNLKVTYYNQNGIAVYQPAFNNIPAYGLKTVSQSIETGLSDGRYSAVIRSSNPIAVVNNFQLTDLNSTTSYPPFSTYNAASGGDGQVFLPSLMHNWFDYHTEIIVMNVGSSDAKNITIEYEPNSIEDPRTHLYCNTGVALYSNIATSSSPLKPKASKSVSQRNLTQLALPYSVECPAFAGRFLGSAKITSDQPIAVVVHQYYQALVNGQWHYKLLTYNGFTTRGKNLFVPGYMRNHYNYYSSLTILNPNPYQMAEVRLTYIADGNFSIPQNGVVDSGLIVIGAEKSMNRFEGPTGSNAQTDLEGFTRFFGSVKIESNIPVIALVNQESTAAAGNQAGAYSAFFVGEGTDTVVVPIIQSAFYGGSYTSLSIMAIGNADADVAITYTSDNQYSTVKNRSKTYYHSTQNGFLNRYEGPTSTSIQSDILDDTFWRDPLTGARYFIGTAVIRSANAKPIVAFVNSESTTALYANVRDSMYTYNAFSLWR